MSGKQFIYLKWFDLDEQKIPKDSSFSLTHKPVLWEKFFFLENFSISKNNSNLCWTCQGTMVLEIIQIKEEYK